MFSIAPLFTYYTQTIIWKCRRCVSLYYKNATVNCLRMCNVKNRFFSSDSSCIRKNFPCDGIHSSNQYLAELPLLMCQLITFLFFFPMSYTYPLPKIEVGVFLVNYWNLFNPHLYLDLIIKAYKYVFAKYIGTNQLSS